MEYTNDAVAIIGIGCRFPGGAETPAEFWDFLSRGGNGVGRVPADRWDADALYHPEYTLPGKISVKWGGFVDGIDMFDAGFFNISPREALRLDPQQRLLLETSYEALEDGGQDVNRLSGSDVGVFVGISAHDYGDIGLSQSERVNITGHTMTGGASSIASNRISYVFNFSGPSYSVDTACSSSLIAAHNACHSLRKGECSMALVGGVNSLIKPETTMSFSKGGFLSPTGTCKAFDARADGYIRSEGAGMLLLKPLEKAVKNRDRVYGVILGSAINHDGRTDGISMPSREAQIEVLKKAYSDAGIDPALVQYVEAHGTGTAIGDPTETSALGEVIGILKEGNARLTIGSVKSNIGHLEPASGAAGLIKLALSLKNGKIPPNIHFEKPNPKIDFEKYRLSVPTQVIDWPGSDAGKLAGINSFGFGGANAHLVLAGPPAAERISAEQDGRPELFVLSAKDRGALKAYAGKYQAYLEKSTASLRDICFTAATRKTHHDVRLVLIVRNKDELREHLQAFTADETRPGMSSGRIVIDRDTPVKTAFVCSGQGPQWWAMARGLIDRNDIFTAVIRECDAELSKYTDWSLMDELLKDEEHSRISETRIVQPALFAVQVGLFRVWESMGIHPDGVVGHSIGEVAAACISGMIDFPTAVKVIYNRSNVQHRASGKGKMLAVGLPEQKAAREIEGYEEKVSVATVNGPALVTLSGDSDVLEQIAEGLDKRDIFHRFLVVDVPFHSYHMEPLEKELLQSLSGLKASEPSIPLYSTVTGKRTDFIYDEQYWYRNIRETVRFTDAVISMIKDGYRAFIELSPHPILSRYITELLQAKNVKGAVAGSIRRKEDDEINLLGNYGVLYTAGIPVPLGSLYPADSGNFTELPSYPFQRERYWIETTKSLSDRTGRKSHPHLSSHTVNAQSRHDHVWNIELDKRLTPYIGDHRVQGPIIFPGAGSCELAIACGKDAFGEDFRFIEDMRFSKAVFLPDEDEPPAIQFNLCSEDGTFSITGRKTGHEGWTRHITGNLRHLGEHFSLAEIPLDYARKRCREEVDMKRIYDELYSSGLLLGPAFRGVVKCSRCTENSAFAGEALGELIAPESITNGIGEFNIHPAILDACFQVLFGSAPLEEDEKLGVYIPVRIERLRFLKKPTGHLFCYGRLAEFSRQYINGELRIYDENSDLCVEIEGFRCRYIEGSRGTSADSDTSMYEFTWDISEFPSQIRTRTPGANIPSPASIEEFSLDLTDSIRQRPEKELYDSEFEPKLNSLSTAYIVEALEKLGCRLKPGTELIFENLLEELNIAGGYIPKLFRRCLDITAEYGILEKKEAGVYRVVKKADLQSSTTLHNTLKTDETYAPFRYELRMLEKCGVDLAGVFTGRTDPVELLFPDEEWDTTVRYYRESYSFRKYNDMIRAELDELLCDFPEHATLRICEVGAGTGGVTSAVLPLLPRKRTTYTFTDISPVFLQRAEEEFGKNFPFVEYKTLDITAPAQEQDIIPGSYDIVIASDVIHATPDIRKTLKGVSGLLAPGGLLLMLEVTQCPWVTDLVFGLTGGWWMFEDHDLRPDHPSMSKETWVKTLSEEGFTDILPVTDAVSDTVSAQTVFLARNRYYKSEPSKPVLPEHLDREGSWLIFSDSRGTGSDLAEKLSDMGETCYSITAGTSFRRISERSFTIQPHSQDNMNSLFTALDDVQLKGIVHLWNTDLPDTGEISCAGLEKSVTIGCTSILNMFRALFRDTDENPPQIWIVTSGAADVEEHENLSLAQTPVWGLGRTIMHEYQHVTTTLIDMSREYSPSESDSLLEELLMGTPCEEVAVRENRRYLHTFRRTTEEEEIIRSMKTVDAEHGCFRLDMRDKGIFDKLHFKNTGHSIPGKNEIEIKVKAAGINFKDVMIAAGLLPSDAPKGGYTGGEFGMECSGIVVSTGSDVHDFKAGDEVMAIAPRALSSYAITKAGFAVKKPSDLTFEMAAALPFAYLTAGYSLNYIGRMVKGEKVLIHSATGGVGLAAVKLARAAGAEVFATAGNSEKREYLRSIGISHVYDSRTLEFGSQIMEDTEGTGVDIVLNSLSGDAIYKSIGVLGRYGRFVEIGKTDIYRNSRLNLRQFWNNITYSAVDIDKLLTEKPSFCSDMFRNLMSMSESGSLSVPPITVFNAAEIPDAFSFIAQAKHIGKVVISFEGNVQVAPFKNIASLLRKDGTYVVAGGFSGLGLEVVRWLAENGAQHVAVISRGGASTEEASGLLAQMTNQGIGIREYKADAADEQAMNNVFREIHSDLPPVRGVINSAMVLDDAILSDMDRERFMTAVRPKVMGGWNLHVNTLKDPVDFFVSFSSISGQYGNPAQSNYAAANTFLDMLSHYRQANGLAASSISWGVIGKVGFVARNEKVKTMLHSQGWKSFSPREATEILGTMILRGAVHRTAADIRWALLDEYYPGDSQSHRFGHLIAESRGASRKKGDSLRTAILAAEPARQTQILRAEVMKTIARILGTSVDKLDGETPVSYLGLDSLMANQLRTWIQNSIGVDFSLMKIMRGPSIFELSKQILSEISSDESETVQSSGEPARDCGGWIVKNRPNPDAEIRLFCFPFMGGGASSFYSWSENLPDSIEVCAVQFPGREDRIGEPPIETYEELIREFAENCSDHFDKPFAFYGHSIGAGIAYETARYLQQHKGIVPVHLFTGGWPAPHLKSPFRIVEHITEDEIRDDSGRNKIMEHLRRLEIPEDVLSDSQLISEMMPSIIADILIGRRYSYRENGKLECAVTAFAGKEDSVFSPDQIQEWKTHTSAVFDFRELPGGHLFMRESRDRLLEIITDELSTYLK